jgi:hypothetical protein
MARQNHRILLANSIFNDFRPTSHTIRQTEQHPAPKFDRICVGFWLILPTDWNSPTVSHRLMDSDRRPSTQSGRWVFILNGNVKINGGAFLGLHVGTTIHAMRLPYIARRLRITPYRVVGTL